MKPTWKPVAPKGCRLCANCGWRIASLGSQWCGACVRLAGDGARLTAPKVSKREKRKRVEEYLYAVGFIPDQNGNFAPAAGRETPA